MRRFSRNIPIVLLWTAGIIFILHMMIPHDHHLPDNLGKESNCQHPENHSDGHKKGLPLHCHALNDLAAEKATKFSIEKRFLQNNIVEIIPEEISFKPDVIVRISGSDLCSDIKKRDFFPSAPLRAPPSVA